MNRLPGKTLGRGEVGPALGNRCARRNPVRVLQVPGTLHDLPLLDLEPSVFFPAPTLLVLDAGESLVADSLVTSRQHALGNWVHRLNEVHVDVLSL